MNTCLRPLGARASTPSCPGDSQGPITETDLVAATTHPELPGLIKQARGTQESVGEGRPGALRWGGVSRGGLGGCPGRVLFFSWTPVFPPTCFVLPVPLPHHSAMLSHSAVSDPATPWTVAHQAALSVRILQVRILECVCISTPSSLPQGFTTCLSPFPARGGGPCILPSSPPSPEAGSRVLRSSGLGGGEGLVLCLRKF